MKLLDKLKNVFFEEVEEDDDEELPQTFAKKIEIPKKTHELTKLSQKEKDVSGKNSEEIEEEKNNIIEKSVTEEPKEEKDFPMMFDESDFLEDDMEEKVENQPKEAIYRRENRKNNDVKELYQGKKDVSYIESVNNKSSYSYTKSYYEEKETTGFRPSPIISPIYGILDKNYRKEEVITKRETRVTSSYRKPDLDSIRNKAFGSDEEKKVESRKNKEVKDKEEANTTKIYDVNSNKPQVNRVTLADADEYYNDLGLAYNVDYSDASRNTSRSLKYNPKDKKNNNVDDNLFDLIDSMYNKED